MYLATQSNDLSTEKDFFELTPSEWWETKFNSLSLLTPNFNQEEQFGYNNRYGFMSGFRSNKTKTNQFEIDYTKPKKEFVKEVNKWKKMNFTKKYQFLEKNNLLNVNFNDSKYTYKLSLKNQLKKLAETQAKEKPKRKRKKTIPKSVKIAVWNKNIGEAVGKHKCLCCSNVDITQMNFHCGHIVAEANGGKVHVDNLLPICSKCNKSMGTQNLNEFKKKFFTKVTI